MELLSLSPDQIVVRDRLRSLNRETVETLKDSIGKLGLRIPISVRFLSDEEGFLLVTGLHRYQACVELGWTDIPVREEDGSEIDARLWEIAENLHRAELTALERSDHIAEWIKLVEGRDLQSAQIGPNENKRADGRGHRHQGGVKAAARDLGIERHEAQRAVKVASLQPEAKEEAKVLNLANHQGALLNAARQPTKEDQIRALREHAAHRANKISGSDATASEKRIESAVSSVKKLSHEELEIFAEWFAEYRADSEKPVFDRISNA